MVRSDALVLMARSTQGNHGTVRVDQHLANPATRVDQQHARTHVQASLTLRTPRRLTPGYVYPFSPQDRGLLTRSRCALVCTHLDSLSRNGAFLSPTKPICCNSDASQAHTKPRHCLTLSHPDPLQTRSLVRVSSTNRTASDRDSAVLQSCYAIVTYRPGCAPDPTQHDGFVMLTTTVGSAPSPLPLTRVPQPAPHTPPPGKWQQGSKESLLPQGRNRLRGRTG